MAQPSQAHVEEGSHADRCGQAERVDRPVRHPPGRDGPGDRTDRVRFNPIGTWTVDPAESSVSFTWRKFRLWTVTGRLHGLGVIHLGELPPAGVIRFVQSSGLPVLTTALGQASVEANGGDPNAMLADPNVVDVRRHRWWTLRSESLEILPDGGWRVMATLTTNRTSGLVDLRLEVDRGASSPDRLVLRDGGCWTAGPLALACRPPCSTARSGWSWPCWPGA